MLPAAMSVQCADMRKQRELRGILHFCTRISHLRRITVMPSRFTRALRASPERHKKAQLNLAR